MCCGMFVMCACVIVWLVCAAGGLRVERRRARDLVTTQGRARGYREPGPPPHYAYLGLPYAAAGAKFQAPEPPPRWDGIFEATHRVRCHQEGAGDENCLVVNVFSPEHADQLPVLVIVHDGNFQSGWGSHKPPTRLLSQGLVIVTFNYRLGALGFLCLNTPEAPGNAGLKDQISALYWVQRNIATFGGDPSNVIVYGIGSGAAAVQIFLLSGQVQGLLHKAILESGSILSPLFMTYDPLQTAYSVAQNMGYNSTDSLSDLADFYNSLPRRKLSNAAKVFLPCMDSSHYSSHGVLEADPMDRVRNGDFVEMPLLITYKQTDGAYVMENIMDDLNSVPENFDKLLPNNLMFDDDEKKQKISELVRDIYFTEINSDILNIYADYFHEVLYEFPVLKFGVLYAKKSHHPVYIMKLKDKNGNLIETQNEKIMDYFYSEGEKDQLIARKLTTLFSNFIKLGDPTPITTSLIPVVWQAVGEGTAQTPTVKTLSVLHFSHDLLSIASSQKGQRLSFWDHIYDNFYRAHSITVL